jgi:hypothetical protein
MPRITLLPISLAVSLSTHAFAWAQANGAAGASAAAAQTQPASTGATGQSQQPAGNTPPKDQIDLSNGLSKDELEILRAKVDELLEQTRLDQDRVRNAVRQINGNLEAMQTMPPDDCRMGLSSSSAAIAAVLASPYVTMNPASARFFIEAERADVLAHPLVVKHPEVLGYASVRANPNVLNHPAVQSNPDLLKTPLVAEYPTLLVDPDSPDLASHSGNTCQDFALEISRLNRNLLIEAYGDSIKQNANLSNQIATRLSQLVDESADLSTAAKRDRFRFEYSLLMERYLRSRLFRVGFGSMYSYLPKVSFFGFERVDLSPFRIASIGGADRLGFQNDFANEGWLSPLISVKAPYFDIDFVSPDLDAKETTVTPVQFTGPDAAGTELLTRSTVESTFRIEYDVGIRVGIGNLRQRHRMRSDIKDRNEPLNYYPKSQTARFDWGLGVGISGFRIDNSVTTDVRFRTDTTSRYDDLTSQGTATTSSSSSFNTAFLLGYFKFRLSDEFEVGFDYRKYDEDKEDGGRIVVSGDTLSINAAYYPTFQRKKKSAANSNTQQNPAAPPSAGPAQNAASAPAQPAP